MGSSPIAPSNLRGFMETKKTLQEALAEANSLIDKIKKALEGIFKDRKRPVPA